MMKCKVCGDKWMTQPSHHDESSGEVTCHFCYEGLTDLRPALTALRARVKELEVESKHLKCELDDRNATLGFVRKKFETTNECYIELLRKFSECNQRLEAIESKQAIKLTEQICVEGEEGIKNIRQYADALDYTPPSTSPIKTKGPKFGVGMSVDYDKPQMRTLKLCRECIDKPEINIYAWQTPQPEDKCHACGRVL